MSQDQSEASSRDRRLEAVLAECLREIEAGRAVDSQAVQAKHPDLADELRSFFANRAAMERLAKPLKPASAVEPTLDLANGEGGNDLQRVRYFGDYELLEELGRGGMGVVYKARQSTLNRLVALKMILSGELASAADVQRFRQEAEAAANLDHPNIAPIYETGEHNGQQYFSMKLIEGRSLREAWNVADTASVGTDAGSIGHGVRLLATAVLHHREPVVRAAATGDGRTLVVATGSDHLARQWQVWELNDDHLPAAPQKSDRAGHALDPSGEFVMAASGSDGNAIVEIIRVADRQVRSRWTMDHVPFAAEFSRSGRWLLTQSEQRRQTGGQFLEVVRFVHVWDWEKGEAVGPPLRLEGAAIPRYTLFHPDESQVITLGGPTAWTFWNVRTGAATSPPPITAATDLTLFTDDGSRLMTHSERQVRLWNPRTWQLERTLDLEVDANNMVHADFAFRGDRAVVIRDGLFTVMDVASEATQFSIPELRGAVGGVNFTPDGSRLVTVMQDGEQRSAAVQLRFWDGQTGRPIGPARRFASGVNLRGFTPSGDLVVLSQESQIHVWDTASGTPVGPPFEHPPSPYKLAFRPDGSALVTAANDATTKVHDLRRTSDGRTLLATLYGHFAGTKRYSLIASESTDGVAWRIRSVVADENCPLTGGEGPCEAATCRLKDGRLMCVFRLASNVPYGQCFSNDEGRTWTAPRAMDGPFSVQPSLAVRADGSIALSGGQPGLYLWLNRAGDGLKWDRIDLLAHHNFNLPA